MRTGEVDWQLLETKAQQLLVIYTIKINEQFQEKLQIISTILLANLAIFLSYLSLLCCEYTRLSDEDIYFHPHWNRGSLSGFDSVLCRIRSVALNLSIFLCLVSLPQNRFMIRWLIIIPAIASLIIGGYRIAEATMILSIWGIS